MRDSKAVKSWTSRYMHQNWLMLNPTHPWGGLFTAIIVETSKKGSGNYKQNNEFTLSDCCGYKLCVFVPDIQSAVSGTSNLSLRRAKSRGEGVSMVFSSKRHSTGQDAAKVSPVINHVGAASPGGFDLNTKLS